jgi:hypothetical protein
VGDLIFFATITRPLLQKGPLRGFLHFTDSNGHRSLLCICKMQIEKALWRLQRLPHRRLHFAHRRLPCCNPGIFPSSLHPNYLSCSSPSLALPPSLSLAPPSIRDTSSTPVGRFLLPRRLPPPVDRASFSTPPTTSSTPVGDGFPRCDGILSVF